MVTCEDILNLKLDGMQLIAGEKGLHRMVSWTYMVQTRPYADHMNRGNFALIVVDYVRFDYEEAARSMEELNELGISGLAVSTVDDREDVPQSMIDRAAGTSPVLHPLGGSFFRGHCPEHRQPDRADRGGE